MASSVTGLLAQRLPVLAEASVSTLDGDPHGAVEDYSKLLAGRPKEFKALSGRGSAHFDPGEWERALEDLRWALERLPPGSPARAWLEDLLG